jgi:hypothetical protein
MNEILFETVKSQTICQASDHRLLNERKASQLENGSAAELEELRCFKREFSGVLAIGASIG